MTRVWASKNLQPCVQGRKVRLADLLFVQYHFESAFGFDRFILVRRLKIATKIKLTYLGGVELNI